MWPDRRIIELFKTEFPIVLAPMAGVMDADLVIAAAQGGALGSLPCAMISAEKAREQVSIIRQRVSAPINLNFFCHEPVEADPAREAGWKQRLESYHQELGLDPAAPVNAANRAPFDAAFCEVVEELKPEVVSFHFGLPDQALLRRVKAAGCLVMGSATIVREAIWLEENGADVIIAQGAEAGGHRGMFLTENIAEQPGTFALVPQVVDAVQVPVRDRGRVRTGGGRCADRQRLSALPGIQSERAGTCRAGAGARRFHRHHQRHDRAAGARRSQSGNARGRADFAPRARIPACRDRAGTAEGGRRKTRQGRFHQPLGRAGNTDGDRHARRRTDARARKQRVGADECAEPVDGLPRRST